jgi:hypothetical protein
MKDQALSGTEIAQRVEQLTGRKYLPQYVGRRLNGARPLVTIHEDFYLLCEVLDINPRWLLAQAVREAILDHSAVGARRRAGQRERKESK